MTRNVNHIRRVDRLVRTAFAATVAGSLLFAGPALAAESSSAQLLRSQSFAIAEVPSRLGFVAAPGGGDTAALPTGSCSGVSACNDFIAECVGAGGDYVPGTHNDKGQPTSGSCGPVQD